MVVQKTYLCGEGTLCRLTTGTGRTASSTFMFVGIVSNAPVGDWVTLRRTHSMHAHITTRPGVGWWIIGCFIVVAAILYALARVTVTSQA